MFDKVADGIRYIIQDDLNTALFHLEILQKEILNDKVVHNMDPLDYNDFLNRLKSAREILIALSDDVFY